jgi:hypothetical protein
MYIESCYVVLLTELSFRHSGFHAINTNKPNVGLFLTGGRRLGSSLALAVPEGARQDFTLVNSMLVLGGDVDHFVKEALIQSHRLPPKATELLIADLYATHFRQFTKECRWVLPTWSSFSASSLRGLLMKLTATPEREAIICAKSRTLAVSATWLKISTRSPFFGGLSMAILTQRAVSEMWMKARVWPPVPYTVSALPTCQKMYYCQGQKGPQRAFVTAYRALHEKSVQNGTVVTVVIKSVNQSLISTSLGGVRAPYNALVQVGHSEAVILVVELEHERIQTLGHVINRAWIRRVQNVRTLSVWQSDVDVTLYASSRKYGTIIHLKSTKLNYIPGISPPEVPYPYTPIVPKWTIW